MRMPDAARNLIGSGKNVEPNQPIKYHVTLPGLKISVSWELSIA